MNRPLGVGGRAVALRGRSRPSPGRASGLGEPKVSELVREPALTARRAPSKRRSRTVERKRGVRQPTPDTTRPGPERVPQCAFPPDTPMSGPNKRSALRYAAPIGIAVSAEGWPNTDGARKHGASEGQERPPTEDGQPPTSWADVPELDFSVHPRALVTGAETNGRRVFRQGPRPTVGRAGEGPAAARRRCQEVGRDGCQGDARPAYPPADRPAPQTRGGRR